MPLDLFIPGKSDLDIITQSHDFSSVEKILHHHFANRPNFSVSLQWIREEPTLLGRFMLDEFPVEVFCQNTKVKSQFAYRHMLIEQWLLEKSGDEFRSRIYELKASGLKTEPAFAAELKLEGDPYLALLELESNPAFQKFAGNHTTP